MSTFDKSKKQPKGPGTLREASSVTAEAEVHSEPIQEKPAAKGASAF